MSENEKKNILGAEVDEEQLNATAGGGNTLKELCGENSSKLGSETDYNNCLNVHSRSKGNCAATVESNSLCVTNDACVVDAIDYSGCICASVD